MTARQSGKNKNFKPGNREPTSVARTGVSCTDADFRHRVSQRRQDSVARWALGSAPARDQCTDIREFKGPTLVTFQGLCETLRAALDGGTYTENPRCETTGSLGGCQSSSVDGSKQTNWYYQGTKYPSEAEARAECESAMRFVTP